MRLKEPLSAYSLYPYTRDDELPEPWQRALSFFYAFKNGRSYTFAGRHKSFEEVLEIIANDARDCPAFSRPCVLVPVPRSGSSRESFAKGACEYPCLALATELTRIAGVRMAELLTRVRPISRASDTRGRTSVDAHRESLQVTFDAELEFARLVLVDDLITRGTQLIACIMVLRQAGYQGGISAFCVSQTVAPSPRPEQLQPYLEHHVSLAEGRDLADREDVKQWREKTW